jgi:hypothetical protein
MKIVVTKSQYKKIILESTEKNLTDKLKKLKDFFNNTSKEIKKQIGLDLNFLVTWGTTIAGFVHPIEEFISGQFPELNNSDLALLSTGIILTYFTSNKKMLGEVLKKIKEDGLIFEFDSMAQAAKKLKGVFLDFINSLAVPVSKIGNMMAYTFLIPIIPDLYELAQGNNVVEIKELITRVIMFLSITSSSILVKRLFKEIVIRFKS